MSSVYQPKRKELAKVKVISSGEYRQNKKKFKFIGEVRRGYTAFVTTQENRTTNQVSFIDDTYALTKRTKNELVQFFSNKFNTKKAVAYLVVDKQK